MSRWDVFDVAFMGTSLTWPPSSGFWLKDCENFLQSKTSKEVRFYQRGLGGAIASTGYSDRGAAIGMRPKVIVLEYAMNDAATSNGITTSQFSSVMSDLINAIKIGSPNSKIALMTMNPTIGEALTRVPNVNSYYQILRNLSVSQSLTLIDNFPLWGSPTAGQIPDGVHPTREALRAVTVPNVANVLQTLID